MFLINNLNHLFSPAFSATYITAPTAAYPCRISHASTSAAFFACSALSPRTATRTVSPPPQLQSAAMQLRRRWGFFKTTGAVRAQCHSRLERTTWGARPLTIAASAFSSRARRHRLGPTAPRDSQGQSAQILPAPRCSHWPPSSQIPAALVLHCSVRTQEHHHVSCVLLALAPLPDVHTIMAAADSQSSHSRPPVDDEGHDQIGSGASTPPGGTATPRPDLHNDKRVPALPNHNYFVQVRDFSFIPPA